MRPIPAFLLLLAVLASGRAHTATLDLPVWRPRPGAVELPAVLGDRFSIQLTPSAAMAARAHAGARTARALGIAGVDRALAALGARIQPEFHGETPPRPGSGQTDFTSFYLVDLPRGVELATAIDRFASVAEVVRAHPIGLASVSAVPNDSLWAGSWHFFQPSRVDIHAPEAWDVTRGDTTIVVAIIDTGVIPYHPDLGGTVAGGHGQIWTNPVEAAGAAEEDDDRNGFVDDVWGWDFVALSDSFGISPAEDWRDEDGDPNDYVGHGTGVAGLVGALSDNHIGVTGTAWNVRLMPLRVGWSLRERQTGVVSMSYVAQAVRYATRMGARVINISLSTTPLPELDAAVSAALASGVSVVLAAGNNGSTNGIFDFPALINVTATDRNDVVPPWANVGDYVDVAAPGAAIATITLVRPGSDSLGMRQSAYVPDANGTSYAAPIVSGVAALVQADRLRRGLPLLDPNLLKLTLMETCDDIAPANPGAPDAYWGAGRINAARALAASDAIHVASLVGKVLGSPVQFAREGGRSGLAVLTDAPSFALVDAESLSVYAEVPLTGLVLPDQLAAGDLGAGRGLGFFVATGSRVHGFGGAGRPLPGWPAVISSGRARNASVGDLDGDGSLDVVAVVEDYYGFQLVYAWDYAGRVRPGFPVPLGQVASKRPALADLDGVAGLEIVVQDGDDYVWVLRHDGRVLPGWPVLAGGSHLSAPVVTRRNGAPLVLVATRRTWYGIEPSGNILLRVDLPSDTPTLDPVLVDLDQDGTDDALLAAQHALHAWYLGPAPTASPSWPQAFSQLTLAEPPVVGNLASAGGQEILQTSATSATVLDRTGSRLPFGRIPLANVTLGATAEPGALLVSGHRTTSLASFALGADAWSPEPQPWPTARGNFARTGCGAGAPAMALADERGPAAVLDFRAETIGPSLLRLIWTSPVDPGPGIGRAVSYDLRQSSRPIGEEDFELFAGVPYVRTPRAAGQAETLEVVPLASGVHYFRLRAVDASGNVSALSNQAASGTPGATPDPVSVVTVTASRTDGLDLRWVATGDDGWVGRPARYEVAASPLVLNPVEFARTPFVFGFPATVDAGGEESASLGPLPSDTHWWIAIRAVDDEGNRSALSEPIEASTLSSGPHVEDRSPPETIDDLRIEIVSLTQARLTWTAPRDDAPLGRATAYEARWATVPFTSTNFPAGNTVQASAWPKLAGARETVWVEPPPSGFRFYAVRSTDAEGRVSDLSNVAMIAAPSAPPGRVADLRVVAATESTVALRWSATGEDGALGMPQVYEVHAATSPLTSEGFDRAPYRFVKPALATSGSPESTFVIRVPRWLHVWIGLKARDRFGFWSSLSNVVESETVTGPPPSTSFRLELASNPARAPIRFRWSLGSAPGTAVALAVHDVTGRRVRSLALGSGSFGLAMWDGNDANGRRAPAGLYFAALSTPSRRSVARVVLLP